MGTIKEEIKSRIEETLKNLASHLKKRRQSPEPGEIKKPKLVQRSKWNAPLTENTSDRQPQACSQCIELINTLELTKDHMLTLQNEMNALIQENFILKEKLFQSEGLRKIIHTKLQELKGPLRVCCRVKPDLNKYIKYPDGGLGEKAQTISLIRSGYQNDYIFDRVFDEQTRQEEVFEELKPYVQTAIDGGKVCIFSYGQTGSGKTYTLEGSEFDGNITENTGVLPRASVLIFSEINRQNLSNLRVFMSCIEVYLDNITDLLQENKILDRKNTENYCWLEVHNINEFLGYIAAASQKRVTRDTHQNSTSSRSHTIYQIRIEGIGAKNIAIKGKISVIDLAGSEKANPETFTDKTTEEIESMKKITEEAKYINKSLSCLKRVFKCLSQKNTISIPPYRETRLTKVLQKQLQEGLVVVIITVSPDNYPETKESLNFGSTVQIARQV
ncbi:hypothetical protein SteCoe_30283 [Stentor coeruleus]|uniref:Kinesin-like protein n=1 Tax=Stentor coeruleus TaxID=5963 RepID=A0A1R2B3X9_9CILI|nr:hypothetical protein SteCoe_30283 [Stentor coeruleus]